jgi:flagellar basal-body rod protein FlgC
MINPLSTSVSGLVAASKKIADVASNVANAGTEGSLDKSSPNQPYTAVSNVTESVPGGGVVATSVPRNPAYVPSYSPDSPFANEQGMVGVPNVNLDEELITMKIAEQAYKANAQVIRTASEMQDELIRALDEKA